MALNKFIVRNTLTTSAVKVSGNSGTNTITLTDDLVGDGFAVQGTPTASIKSITWTGDTGGVITIKRNNEVIFTLQANAAGMLDFSGDFQFPENTFAEHDIVVSVNGIQCELWLRLSKSGYSFVQQSNAPKPK